MSQSDAPENSQLAFFVSGVVATGAGAPALRHRRIGDAFTAERVVLGKVLEVGENVLIRFALDGASNADFVQLDIPAVPGTYRIERLSLCGTLVEDLARRIISVRDRLLDGSQQHQVRYADDTRRPMIEVDMRGLAAVPATRADLDVAIVREDASEELRSAIMSNAEAQSDLARKQARELGELAYAHGQELRRQSSRLDEHGARLSAIAGTLAAQGAAIGALGEDGRHAAEHARAQLAALSDAVSAMRAAQQQSETHLLRLQQGLDHVNWSIENVFWRRWLRRLRGARS